MFLEKFSSKQPCSPVSWNLFFMIPDQFRLNQLRTGIIYLTKYSLHQKIPWNTLRLSKNLKINFSDKTTLISILDNLSYYLSAFILKHNPLPCPFYPFGFLLFLCLSVSHIGSYCFCFLLFLYEDLRNSKHCIQ